MPRALLAPLAALLLAFGVAACGSESEGGGEAADNAATQTQPVPAGQSTNPGTAQNEGELVPSTEGNVTFTSGLTTLALDQRATQALERIGVKIRPTQETALVNGEYRIPITQGNVDVDTPSGTIEHTGGLRFEAGGQGFTAENLQIDMGQSTLTGEVGGQRVQLFSLDLNEPEIPPEGGNVVWAGSAQIPGSGAIADQLGVTLPGSVNAGDITISGQRQ